MAFRSGPPEVPDWAVRYLSAWNRHLNIRRVMGGAPPITDIYVLAAQSMLSVDLLLYMCDEVFLPVQIEIENENSKTKR